MSFGRGHAKPPDVAVAIHERRSIADVTEKRPCSIVVHQGGFVIGKMRSQNFEFFRNRGRGSFDADIGACLGRKVRKAGRLDRKIGRLAQRAEPAFRGAVTASAIAATRSGAGDTRKVSSVSTPSVPKAPHISLGRSKPVTFLMTRPPAAIASPLPLTKRQPIDVIAHRAGFHAPRAARIRRHDSSQRGTPRFRAEQRSPIGRLEAEHLFLLGKGRFDFGERRPARTVSTNSSGSYFRMPESALTSRIASAATGRPNSRLVPPETISNDAPFSAASRTASASAISGSLMGDTRSTLTSAADWGRGGARHAHACGPIPRRHAASETLSPD